MTTMPLPTFRSGDWTVTAFRDSLLHELANDRTGTRLELFLYAVTELGWAQIRTGVRQWQRAIAGRSVSAYVGTDHGLTEPDALARLRSDGVEVWIPTEYDGVFHPKVVRLQSAQSQHIWVGSNNLTREALLNNIEFAVLVRSEEVPPSLEEWCGRVRAISEALDDALLDSYRSERRQFADARSVAGTFVWTRRERPRTTLSPRQRGAAIINRAPVTVAQPAAIAGDLVIEVMPRETGMDGKQVQLPKAAAVRFFHLRASVGASRIISMRYLGDDEPRDLTMTLFGNNTVRLSLADLDYRHRPCLIRFHRTTGIQFEYEIVQRAIYPRRYAVLLATCTEQSRDGSRRWGIIGP